LSTRVSIVIPVYNGANYLREAIDSALAQTHPDLEVLVVNDGSTDGGATDSIARSYGERIRYLAKENGGVSSALNLGIASAAGDYISWLSHDDVFLPEKISRSLEALEGADPGTIIYTDIEMIDEAGRTLLFRKVADLEARGAGRTVLLGAPVNMCTTLINRSCFDQVGTFDTALPTVQDLDMLLRLAIAFPFKRVPQPLLRSRQHPGQGSRAISRHARNVDEYLAGRVSGLTPVQLFGSDTDPDKEFLAMAQAFSAARRHLAAAAALDRARDAWGPANRWPLKVAQWRLAFSRLRGEPGTRVLGIDLTSLDSEAKRALYRFYLRVRGRLRPS
jgi:hypothetical protein